jgi:hypothetical protein
MTWNRGSLVLNATVSTDQTPILTLPCILGRRPPVKRLLTFGFVFASTAAVSVFGGEPVSVYPPAASTSGLNQPLPNAIQSAAITSAPPPVLLSTPSWAGGAPIPTSQAVPIIGPNYLSSSTPACTECNTGVRPHFNLLSAPQWLTARVASTNCEPRASFWERLKAWIGYHPTETSWRRSAAGYQAPLRTYNTSNNCPIGGCDVAAGDGRCETGQCAPTARTKLLGGLRDNRTTYDVNIPVNPLSTVPDANCTAARPRVVYVPLSSRTDVKPTYGQCGAEIYRPSLIKRLIAFFSGEHLLQAPCASGTCGQTQFETGNITPPPYAPVHYAMPVLPVYSAPIRYTERSAETQTMPPPSDTLLVPPVPMLPPVAVPNLLPLKTGSRLPSATRPFTNP